MTNPRILSIATAVPPYRYEQEETKRWARDNFSEALGAAVKTIRNHINNLNAKFGTRDYKETVAQALRLELAYPDSYA